MKYIVSILFTALLAFVLGLWLDWWSIAIAAFVIGLLVHQRAGKSFSAGFVGIFLLWGLMAWWYDYRNQSILSKKIAEILPLSGSSILLILLTAVIGGIVAGFAAMSGSYLRSSR